jgi:hypothetical protein
MTMKTIKTRNVVKDIKTLDKPVILASRMKSGLVKTKERAEDTQNTRQASPVEYAGDNIERATLKPAQYIPNPVKNTRKSMEKAGKNIEEFRKYLPKERTRVAEQSHKAAQKAKTKAETLKNSAENAKDTACEAKTAVKDAKRTLKETRQAGRQTVREVRQTAKVSDLSAGSKAHSVKSAGTSKGAAMTHGSTATGNAMKSSAARPAYISKGVGGSAASAEKGAKGAKTATKGFKDTAKGSVKTAKKSVKTADRSAKLAVKTARNKAKTARKTARTAVKTAKAAEKAARAAALKAKATVKGVILMVKATIAALKGLIALLAVGGKIAVVIILLICMIALFVHSVFGIFFSSEPNPETGQTLNSVLREIDTEYTDTLNSIIAANPHDYLDMSGARAAWRNVLAVYTVRTVTDPDNPMAVAMMDDEMADLLRSVFWDMNTISYVVDSISIEVDELDDDGVPTGETITETVTVLRIFVTHMTADEAAEHYSFCDEQLEWLEELLKPEYNHLWNMLLFGITSIGDGTMIEIAITQLGNIGGEPYWRWWGLNSRVPWCAIFVSWVAEQAGFIDAGIMPRFASCTVGIQWFRDRGQWMDNSYIPAPGDLIFFDWNGNGISDHVGIVEFVEGDFVHTIEGNTSDSVARRVRRWDSVTIMGYGVPVHNS